MNIANLTFQEIFSQRIKYLIFSSSYVAFLGSEVGEHNGDVDCGNSCCSDLRRNRSREFLVHRSFPNKSIILCFTMYCQKKNYKVNQYQFLPIDFSPKKKHNSNKSIKPRNGQWKILFFVVVYVKKSSLCRYVLSLNRNGRDLFYLFIYWQNTHLNYRHMNVYIYICIPWWHFSHTRLLLLRFSLSRVSRMFKKKMDGRKLHNLMKHYLVIGKSEGI